MRARAKTLATLLAAILVVACMGPAEALPSNTLVSVADGSELPMSGWVGKQTLLVFFSPLCPSCRTELKELEKFAGWPAGRNLRIVAVAPDGYSRKVMEKLVSLWGLKRIEVFNDPGNGLFKAFNVKKVPYTVLFGADGAQKESFLGAANASQVEEFLGEQPL